MVKLTVENLKDKLAKLQARRVQLAYRSAGDLSQETIGELAVAQSAIAALETLIAAGADDPTILAVSTIPWGK